MSLSSLLDVMRSDNDRFVAVFRDLNQMIPDTSDKQKKNVEKTMVYAKRLWSAVEECR